MQTSSLESVDTHRWTRRQYEQMVDAGVLTADDRVELIEGHIVPMRPQNSRHATSVEMTRRVLEQTCSSSTLVRAQFPLALGAASEPEPDVAVVPGTIDDYVDQHPSEALLVIEVADSPLANDREQKRLLYAQHGIPEYWIVNLVDQHLAVYRDPAAGDYKSKTTLDRSDTVTLPFADTALSVADLIPA